MSTNKIVVGHNYFFLYGCLCVFNSITSTFVIRIIRKRLQVGFVLFKFLKSTKMKFDNLSIMMKTWFQRFMRGCKARLQEATR